MILRIHSSLKDKMASVGSQTIYNIQSQGGIVQTGNGSKATLISINLSNKNEIIRSLDFVLESIREAKDIDAGKKEETKEMIDELRLEIAKQKPNGIKLSSLLFGLAATIQTIASIQPAYNALKAAILPLGIHLP